MTLDQMFTTSRMTIHQGRLSSMPSAATRLAGRGWRGTSEGITAGTPTGI
jgi:hypothetical protein